MKCKDRMGAATVTKYQAVSGAVGRIDGAIFNRSGAIA